jgi:hypothetical protein
VPNLFFFSYCTELTCFFLLLSCMCRSTLHIICIREIQRSAGIKELHRKPFTLHHCLRELEHDEKYKNRGVLEVPKRSTKIYMGVVEWILYSPGYLHTPFQIFIQDILTHF